ncbi:hypothetical protein PENSPDRAFT_647347 [Peniophora sp. CONT]|nr:hypothetical protein PENSPDRAFT_647347 [Peniophora sp. CONT]
MGADGKCTANTKDNADNQKWYFDTRSGDVAIHNKANGTYLTFASIANSQRTFCAEQTATPKIFKLFATDASCDKYIIAVQDKPNMVLDVSGADKKNGAAAILYTKHGKGNQVWLPTLADPAQS